MLCGPLPSLGLSEQHTQISIPSPYLLAAFATPRAPPASRDPYQPRPGGFPPHISRVGAGLLEPRSQHAELCAELSLVLLVGVHCLVPIVSPQVSDQEGAGGDLGLAERGSCLGMVP